MIASWKLSDLKRISFLQLRLATHLVTLLGILKSLFKGTGSAANDIGSGMRKIGCKWYGMVWYAANWVQMGSKICSRSFLFPHHPHIWSYKEHLRRIWLTLEDYHVINISSYDIGSGMRRIGCKWGQKCAADPSNAPILISDLISSSYLISWEIPKNVSQLKVQKKSINSNKKNLFRRMWWDFFRVTIGQICPLYLKPAGRRFFLAKFKSGDTAKAAFRRQIKCIDLTLVK